MSMSQPRPQAFHGLKNIFYRCFYDQKCFESKFSLPSTLLN